MALSSQNKKGKTKQKKNKFSLLLPLHSTILLSSLNFSSSFRLRLLHSICLWLVFHSLVGRRPLTPASHASYTSPAAATQGWKKYVQLLFLLSSSSSLSPAIIIINALESRWLSSASQRWNLVRDRDGRRRFRFADHAVVEWLYDSDGRSAVVGRDELRWPLAPNSGFRALNGRWRNDRYWSNRSGSSSWLNQPRCSPVCSRRSESIVIRIAIHARSDKGHTLL